MHRVVEKIGAAVMDEVGEVGEGEVGATNGSATPLLLLETDFNLLFSSCNLAISSSADCKLCSS
jgi:hypothetical protein